jgi:hypothetical protein
VAEEPSPASTRLDVTAVLTGPRRSRQATRRRLVRIFRRGWITSLVALLDQAPLPLGACRPEPWPVVPIGEFHAMRPELDLPHVAA